MISAITSNHQSYCGQRRKSDEEGQAPRNYQQNSYVNKIEKGCTKAIGNQEFNMSLLWVNKLTFTFLMSHKAVKKTKSRYKISQTRRGRPPVWWRGRSNPKITSRIFFIKYVCTSEQIISITIRLLLPLSLHILLFVNFSNCFRNFIKDFHTILMVYCDVQYDY